MSDRTEFLDLTDPEVAKEAVADFDLAGDAETVPLAEADGRVLAERVDATMDVPGFDRASMDGYAVRSRDTVGAGEADPATLDVVGAVHAGEEPDAAVEAGTAVEVSTGAVVPPGADAVVKVERTERRGDAVDVRTAVTPGENVMPAGDDVAAGERAFGPGTVLTSREVGLLAALGHEEVPVRPRPRVAVVSTGEELVAPGEQLNPEAGQIYDVNGRAIAATVRDAGGEAVVAPQVPDDRDALAAALEEYAGTCDLVLTSGSTSAGAVDVLGDVVADLGEVHHHGVAIKPGKPTLIGRVAGTPYVGLPGYPVSAQSVFRAFVAPAIRAAAGRPPLETPERQATMGTRLRYDEGRDRLLPVGLVTNGDGDALAYPVDKGSGATTSLAHADGVIEVAAETVMLEAGDAVDVRLFGTEVRPPRLLGVGEDDPTLWRLLDAVDRTRYLSVGSTEGARRLDGGVPDVAVVTGDDVPGGERLGGWTREWGLVAAPDAGVDSLADLVDGDATFVNRSASGLRDALSDAVGDLAAERGKDRAAVADGIAGYDRVTRGHEGPARRVADGDADAGLGLRSTAERLDLAFVSLGDQPVRVVASADRVEKPGVRDLATALERAPEAVETLPGVSWGE
ncbi:molybdopterin biosynthesis protein [Halomicrobium salinisoli]|uniref:molybdopterin biosynthesis protein n=1 Tax=Halomicrobium salinisoli TaxID=2878391 RepID=UPI001CEFC30D|nr:molybdopterin biosynthesis protein [Halomicrobium salinisoli]